MYKKLSFLLILVLISIAISGCAGTAMAQAPTGEETGATRTISVTGSGKAVLTPDIAYVNIGVHTEDKKASEAVKTNNQQTQAVIDSLKGFNIAEKDIQTVNFSITPQQQYDNNGRPTGEITYLVDNTVYVTVRDLAKIGNVLDASVQAGANSINGIQFDVADKTAALSEARKSAVENAQAIATEMATAAGVSLGDVQTISLYGGATPQPMYDFRSGMPAADVATVPISPGQLMITIEVSVVYAIR